MTVTVTDEGLDPPSEGEGKLKTAITIAVEEAGDMNEGLQIVSDGTVEGTRVLLDGAQVKGVTEATWRFNARERKATLVLEMADITLDVTTPVDASVREALAAFVS